MKLTFRALSENDFPLLHRWLETPHVREWWDSDIDWTVELIHKKYARHIGDPKIKPCLILIDDHPIGYIQGYNAYDYPRDPPLEGLPESLVAFDMYIGELDYLGQGLGARKSASFFNNTFLINLSMPLLIQI